MNFNATIPVLELKITKEEQCIFQYQNLAIHYLSQTSSLPAFPHIVRAPPWSSHSPYLTPGQKHTDPCCSLPVDMSTFLSRLFLLIGKALCSPLIPVSITVSGTLRELVSISRTSQHVSTGLSSKTPKEKESLAQSWQTCSLKNQTVNISDFESHVVSLAASQPTSVLGGRHR